MADNITTPGAGSVLATDEIGGVHYPRNKISFGADGAAVDVSSANPFPVTLPGALAVTGTFWQATQPVSLASQPLPTGAATETTLAAASAKLPATLGAKAGTASFSIVPATDAAFAVTGTFYPATQPVSATSLPLPAGAATSAKQDTNTAAIDNLGTAKRWFAITVANSDLTVIPDCVYVGGAGTVIARGDDDIDATFTASAGAVLPIRPKQIRTGGTATGLIGLVN